MKNIAIAFVTAVIIAIQLFTPVAAAAPSAGLADGSCGDTYTVQRGDWLAKIARNCGTSVADILARNPQICNPNLIYGGMVLNLTGSMQPWHACYYPYQGWYGGYYYPYQAGYGGYYTYQGGYIPPSSSTSTYAWVSQSTTRAAAGDSVTIYVHGFPANAYIDYRVGKLGEDYSAVYDGRVDANGYASATITIPSAANSGENWIVQVITTEGTKGVQINSRSIYITS
jgi:LysM repeat protein